MKKTWYLIAMMGLAFGATGCAELEANLRTAPDRATSEFNTMKAEDRTAKARNESYEAEKQAEAQAEKAKEDGAPAEVTSPLHVTLDGVKDDSPDAYGIYWDTEDSVSAEPTAVVEMDPSLGDFLMMIVNVYEAKEDGTESNTSWSINDFARDRHLMPGKPFQLSGEKGIMIIDSERETVEKIDFESGKTYIALFSVTGSEGAHTHKVRFKIK